MPMDPEYLYQMLGQLIKEMPDLRNDGTLSHEQNEWLGRACALVEEAGNLTDAVFINTASKHLTLQYTFEQNLQTIKSILYKMLSSVELKLPASARGAFIPAGNAFDALSAIGKVMQEASEDILVVDPYMDEKALTSFAVLARQGVNIRLLADESHVKPSLKPAAQAWIAQYGMDWPLDIRLTGSRALHDRLIIVDNHTAYILTQSLNAFANRSPATLARTDADTAALKIDAYSQIWQGSTPFL